MDPCKQCFFLVKCSKFWRNLMLKPSTIEQLNKVYPQYSFVREAGSVYCFNDDNVVVRVAEAGYTDYFAFHSMFDKISPVHFKQVSKAIKQIVSAYLFFSYPFLEKQRHKFFILTLNNLYCDRDLMGQKLVVNYVTKYHDDTIYWSPEIQMGNDKFYLHLTNYNTVNKFNLLLTTSTGGFFDIDLNIDDLEHDYKNMVHFFFNHMFKPYIGIEVHEFTPAHLKVLDMVVI